MAPPAKRVLVAGELNPDLIFSGLESAPLQGREILAKDFSLQLGSSSAIFAAGLAKLGIAVSFTGKVGDDFFGRYCVSELERMGVDVSAVIVEPRVKTGATVSLSGADRALVTYPGAIAEMRGEDVSDALLAAHGHLHVASYYLQRALRPGLRELLARARRFGLTTSLDPGCDPEGRWGSDIIDLLSEVDVFLLNEIELTGISGAHGVEEGLQRLSQGSTHVVAKLGASGCAIRHEAGVYREPAIRVDVVDTTGAGDSFDAGFLAAWLRGLPTRSCLRYGTICGGLSTLGLGGTSSQPDWERVEAAFATMIPTEGPR